MIEKAYVVPIQNQCNCDCKFCISKTRNYNKAVSTLALDNQFNSSLKRLRKLGANRFEITGGGEPFLNPNLQAIIDEIKNLIPDSFIKLYTNGRLMKKVSGVDEVDISLADIDEKNNKKLMGYKDNCGTMDIIKFYRGYAPKLRLSIPIIRDAIDSPEKMLDLIELTRDWVDEYVVRPLYEGALNRDEMFADFEIHNGKVVMEKDNCLCDFQDKLILWSDGILYNDWTLGTIKQENN